MLMKANQQPPPQSVPPYDSNEYVRVITESGFSPEQAQGLVSGMNICLANLVTKDDLDKVVAKLIAENEKAKAEAAERETRAIKDAAEREVRIMSEISAMKAESAERETRIMSEISAMKAENEKAKAEAAERETRVMDAIIVMQGQISAMKAEAAEREARIAKDAAERDRKLTFWIAGTAVGLSGLVVAVAIGFATLIYDNKTSQQGAANAAAVSMQSGGQQW